MSHSSLSPSRLRLLLLAGLVALGWMSARPVAAALEDWCGQEGEKACSPATNDYWSNGGKRGCDRGLKPDSARVCVNDTRYLVTPDAWAVATLAFQRELTADRPINAASWLSSHNAYNTLADGYYAPNQVYSMTDQLRLGVRHLMLDVHWVNDMVRLCHGPVCDPRDRFYYHGLRELDHWLRLPENAGEILLIRFEDDVDDAYASAMTEPIRLIFGDRVYRPAEKPPDSWPTLNALRSLGKQIIFFSEGNTWGGQWVFTDWHEPTYPLDKVFHFDRNWPACTYTDDNGVAWPLDRAAFSEFYEARLDLGRDTGLINQAVMQDLLVCGVSVIGTDRLMPARSAHGVWSWAVNRPNGSGQCAALRGDDGRWLDADCAESRPFACVRPNDPTDWRVTVSTGGWSAGAAACAAEFPGYNFGLPRNADENRRLAALVGDPVWLNLYEPVAAATIFN